MSEALLDPKQWIGRERVSEDVVNADRLARLSAALDRDDPPPQVGDPLPPPWHWMLFYDLTPLAEAGPDGHARRGSFLPPISLPRRMWAGSRISFPGVVPVGASIKRVSRIQNLAEKAGRTGKLVFLTLSHEIFAAGTLAVREEQDIVYRALPKPGDPPAPEAPRAPAQAKWRRTITPSSVLLFRYSALTYNSHRIHYDWKYCTEVEGYPGLVVHGPLTATLLVDMVRRALPARPIVSFGFRAVAPLFDTAPFTVAGMPAADGRGAKVWAQTPEGRLAMEGEIGFG